MNSLKDLILIMENLNDEYKSYLAGTIRMSKD